MLTAREPQLLKPAHLEPMLPNKRSHRNKKPAHHNEEQPPLASTREKPARSNEDQTQPIKNNYYNNNNKNLKQKTNKTPSSGHCGFTHPFLLFSLSQ